MRILALLQSLNVTQNPVSLLVIILPLKRMKFSNVSSHQWIYCKDDFDPFFSLLTATKQAGAMRRNSCKDMRKQTSCSSSSGCLHIPWNGADAVHSRGCERFCRAHLANRPLGKRDAAWKQRFVHLLVAYRNAAYMLIFIILSNFSLDMLLKKYDGSKLIVSVKNCCLFKQSLQISTTATGMKLEAFTFLIFLCLDWV